MSAVSLTLFAITQWQQYASGIGLLDPIDYLVRGCTLLLLNERADEAFDMWMNV